MDTQIDNPGRGSTAGGQAERYRTLRKSEDRRARLARLLDAQRERRRRVERVMQAQRERIMRQGR
jgi:hypothetical protein